MESAEAKIDKETAKNEFCRYCESNGIEHEESAMSDEEKDTFKDIKKRFLDACMAGRVEVDGTTLKYTLSNFSPEGFGGKVFVIKRPSGHAFSSMDGWKEKESVHKLVGFMSAITGQELKTFSKIDIFDWKFVSSIATLFLSL